MFSQQGIQILAGLRQKRQAAAANSKPAFGPLPSNAIFESKWLSKLNHHNLAFPKDRKDETLAAHVSQAFDLVTAFEDEANTLDLTAADFTYEPTTVIQGKVWEKVFINPFTTAEVLRDEVNFYVHEWKQLWKVEPALEGALKIQAQLVKTQVEPLMVKVYEAEFAGAWDSQAADYLASILQTSTANAAQVPLRTRQRRKWW